MCSTVGWKAGLIKDIPEEFLCKVLKVWPGFSLWFIAKYKVKR